jgi:hypothetical protein
VSPGAPFRHFPSRDALMNAVAEEAQRRFRAEIELALAEAPAGDPLGPVSLPRARLHALGDEESDPFRNHLQPPLLRSRQVRGRVGGQCRS